MPTPNDSLQTDNYVNNGVSNDYTLLPGVCVLPLAEDPPTDLDELAEYSPIVIARLHAPYRIRNMNFRTEKQNNPPVAPTPGDIGAFVFLGGDLDIFNRMNATVGSYDWSIGGTYTYVENCVSRIQDGFVLGSQPFTWTSDYQNALTLGVATLPSIGAIAQAGPSAVIGYVYGNNIVYGPGSGSQTGALLQTWGYNCPAFFPGTLFNDQLANGGGTL